jgi:spore germination protein KC
MKYTAWILILSSVCLLTGCWNRRELNELALAVAISVDKSEDQYEVTLQVVDPGEVASKQGSTGRTPVTTYSEKGDHLFEAFRKITTISPRRIYFSHVQMFVISEELAKEGIRNTLDLLTRDAEFRQDFYIVVAKDIKAKEILNNLTSIEKIPANKLHSSLETSEKSWAPTVAVQLDELISSMTSDGKEAVLTGITIVGNIAKGRSKDNVQRINAYSRLAYTSIAVFDDDRLVGWLDERESKGYNYVLGNVRSTVCNIPCPGKGELVLEIFGTKPKVKGKFIHGKPQIDIDLSIEANIGEVSCKMDLTKPETISEIEKNANKVNEDILKASIKKAKELEVDIFGFGEVIHRTNPKQWKKLRKDWNREFVELPVEVHTNFKLSRTGTVNQSFLNNLKE